MNAIATVSSVRSRFSAAFALQSASQTRPTETTPAVKAGDAVQKTKIPPSVPASTPPPITQSGTPLGLLEMVTPPSASNNLANSDYRALRNAIWTGNPAAAQAAYKRLQTDLALVRPFRLGEA